MVHTEAEIHQEVRRYIFVFVGLAFLTVVTVAVSYLHLQLAAAITLALIIACIKASLVACYFMHLISEKALIYTVLVFVFVFLISVLFLPYAGFYDHIPGTQYHKVPEQTHHVS